MKHNALQIAQYMVLAVFVVAAAYGLLQRDVSHADDVSVSKSQSVVIDGHALRVVVADTPEMQQKGLGGYTTLADDEGMLFRFANAQPRVFWMKDMVIPIDIIWIHDGAIIGYEDEVQPEPGMALQALTQYPSPLPVETVLEVRAGLRQEKSWRIGTKVTGLD